MSKRGGQKFPRKKRDFYRTPLRAVVPLIAHLRAEGIQTFAEPFVGKNDLLRHLESFGLHCVYRGDIGTGQDARLLTAKNCKRAQAIITNPPHTRALMHALITQFISTGLPTWLLIDLDWVSNLCAVPYLPRCSDAIIIGRVKWIDGTRDESKDNFAWYRFHAAHEEPTRIYNDRQRRTSTLELQESTQ